MRFVEKALLISAYLILPLVPVYLFIHGASGNLTFFVLISRAAGIYAFVWFSLQFILTSRLRVIERVAGQDRLVTAHFIAAAAALALIAVHTGLGEEERGMELQRWFGGAGLIFFLYGSLFSAVFFSSFFIRFVPFLIPWRNMIAGPLKLTYERCLQVHYIMPAGLVLVMVHVNLLPGAGLGAFKLSMTAAAASGLCFYAYRKFLDPVFRRRRPWNVAEVYRESDSVTTLIFEDPTGRRLRHHPGQFCYLVPLDSKIPRESHPFTVSSSPEDPRPKITVKNLGDFTSGIKTMNPGDTVCLEGPYGKFSCRHVQADRELILIAGGIGITPMISMLGHLSRNDPERKVTLIWSARNLEDLIRLEEIESFSNRMKDFTFVPVLSREPRWKGRKGRIDRALLAAVLNGENGRQEASGLKEAEVFLCGPPPMVSTVLRALTGLGVERRRIHTERFAF